MTDRNQRLEIDDRLIFGPHRSQKADQAAKALVVSTSFFSEAFKKQVLDWAKQPHLFGQFRVDNAIEAARLRPAVNAPNPYDDLAKKTFAFAKAAEVYVFLKSWSDESPRLELRDMFQREGMWSEDDGSGHSAWMVAQKAVERQQGWWSPGTI